MGVAVTAIVLAGLVIIGAPPIVRLVLTVPAAGAAIGYLQAILRFCAGFASRGVFNFGALGTTDQIVDPESRARDHARALQIALASLAIGVVVGLVAVALPL